MESWFIRKLEKLELDILDRHDQNLNKILKKLRRFKKEKPWRDGEIKRKETLNSEDGCGEGSLTPYSNYSDFSMGNESKREWRNY